MAGEPSVVQQMVNRIVAMRNPRRPGLGGAVSGAEDPGATAPATLGAAAGDAATWDRLTQGMSPEEQDAFQQYLAGLRQPPPIIGLSNQG